MSSVFEYGYQVQPEDINEFQHADNLAYLRWLLKAAYAHSKHVGWNNDAYRELGCAWVVRKHEIEYFKAALEGDQLTIRTWVDQMKRVSCLRRYEIIRAADDSSVVVASTQWTFVNLETGRPQRIPEQVLNAFPIGSNGESESA